MGQSVKGDCYLLSDQQRCVKGTKALVEHTEDQKLRLAVAAHQGGKLEAAERLYLAILQVQPNHPDANHNLGVLKAALGEPLEAIPLFELALKTNSQSEQFWLSYIAAAIAAEKFDEAKKAFVDGERIGITSGKLNVLRAQLEKAKSSAAEPSQDQIDRLLGYYQAGESAEAEGLALSLTRKFPGHAFAWKVLGVLLNNQGRFGESLIAKQKSVDLSPQDPEAHCNLSNTLMALARVSEAEESARRAIALNPDHAEAHVNLGVTLKAQNKLGEAISSYVRAINLRGGDYSLAYAHLGDALKGSRFDEPNRGLYPIFINMLTRGHFVRPSEVAVAILSLLKRDTLIADLRYHTTTFTKLKEVVGAIEALNGLPLLHSLMRLCPLPDLQLEQMFVSIRRVLLTDLGKMELTPEVANFLATLSLQCFINEYVYSETEEEAARISGLEKTIEWCISRGEQPNIEDALRLATYRPLHEYDWCRKLEVLNELPEVRRRLIDEPLTDSKIAQEISVLTDVEEEVSRKVRAQYEENPYPRWVKCQIATEARSVAAFCNGTKLRLFSDDIKETTSPSILIAGCGTGQHSIGIASIFACSRVTAVDLSRASLAYAQRKTTELDIDNIEYMQADILKLDQLKQKFDIIDSSGVLHHMAVPLAGWRVLSKLLRSGGLMKIGLYSEIARRHIVSIRAEIASRRLEASSSGIRQYRQYLAGSDDEHHSRITRTPDFFSLSMLRDLIFHVQEHRFTLPQIQHCLDQLGLQFCGFENLDIVAEFRKSFGSESDPCDLSLWHRFEQERPHIFMGMYQFWCQKA